MQRICDEMSQIDTELIKCDTCFMKNRSKSELAPFINNKVQILTTQKICDQPKKPIRKHMSDECCKLSAVNLNDIIKKICIKRYPKGNHVPLLLQQILQYSDSELGSDHECDEFMLE